MKRRIKFYISPYFLIKFYLYKEIKKISRRYDFSGMIIDIGCGEKPYKKIFQNCKKYKGIDFKKYSKNNDYCEREKPDYYFSHSYLKSLILPFKDNSFNHSVSFQVIEHHKNPPKMIKEMIRITKPGGYLIITSPFLGGLHEKPNDYQRYTEYGFRQLLKPHNCKILEIKKTGITFFHYHRALM